MKPKTIRMASLLFSKRGTRLAFTSESSRCQLTGEKPRLSSSLAFAADQCHDSDQKPIGPAHRYCATCTCSKDSNKVASHSPPMTETGQDCEFSYPCGSALHEDEFGVLPPPLPEPVYSVHKRVLPASLTAMSSKDGKRYLLEALQHGTAESYWALTEQFVNQSDPAFCGITTLLMVLNAAGIDPNIRWKGGWRFFASEDVLLDRCCLSAERIRRVGVTLEEFRMLAKCNGLLVNMKRPCSENVRVNSNLEQSQQDINSLDSFRSDICRTLTTEDSKSMVVVSFSRAGLGQTGDGHFSPLAAYHEETDQVLVLDVARFKYAPYWVSIVDLFKAMQAKDSATRRARGWFLLHPPSNIKGTNALKEDRRPADLVPLVGEEDVCPIGRVKVDFCQANPNRNSGS